MIPHGAHAMDQRLRTVAGHERSARKDWHTATQQNCTVHWGARDTSDVLSYTYRHATGLMLERQATTGWQAGKCTWPL